MPPKIKKLKGALSKAGFRYSINIQWSDEDQVYIATVPELPGCKTHGKTYEEALQQAKYAIEGWIEFAKELGRAIPSPNKVVV